MRFYNITSIIKTTKVLFSLKNKQFIMLENKPFVFGALLLKHPKFDQKLIRLVDKPLMKIFSNSVNNNKFIGFLKMMNILKRVLLCSSKEKRVSNLKTMLEELRKVYLKNLNFDSLYLLIRLVNFFLMIRKLLKGIYIM